MMSFTFLSMCSSLPAIPFNSYSTDQRSNLRPWWRIVASRTPAMKNSLMATRTHASDLLDGTVDQFLGYLIGWGVFQPICLWSRFLVIFGQQNGIRSSPALSLFPGVRVEQCPVWMSAGRLSWKHLAPTFSLSRESVGRVMVHGLTDC